MRRRARVAKVSWCVRRSYKKGATRARWLEGWLCIDNVAISNTRVQAGRAPETCQMMQRHHECIMYHAAACYQICDSAACVPLAPPSLSPRDDRRRVGCAFGGRVAHSTTRQLCHITGPPSAPPRPPTTFTAFYFITNRFY